MSKEIYYQGYPLRIVYHSEKFAAWKSLLSQKKFTTKKICRLVEFFISGSFALWKSIIQRTPRKFKKVYYTIYWSIFFLLKESFVIQGNLFFRRNVYCFWQTTWSRIFIHQGSLLPICLGRFLSTKWKFVAWEDLPTKEVQQNFHKNFSRIKVYFWWKILSLSNIILFYSSIPTY